MFGLQGARRQGSEQRHHLRPQNLLNPVQVPSVRMSQAHANALTVECTRNSTPLSDLINDWTPVRAGQYSDGIRAYLFIEPQGARAIPKGYIIMGGSMAELGQIAKAR